MKKLIFAAAMACAILAGLKIFSATSAIAQTGTAPVVSVPLANNSVFIFTNVLAFTNNPLRGFTNTLVQPTNLLSLRLSNVVTLLLTLQTNIEETLPVLAVLTSNASVTTSPTSAGATQVPSAVIPITSAPAGLFLAPTGRTNATQQPAVISMTLGTNVIEIDPPTFQALVLLQSDLEQTLPVLQMLNGTAPKETNAAIPGAAITTPLTNSFSPVPNFGVSPLTTSGLAPPLTNQPQVLTTPSPF